MLEAAWCGHLNHLADAIIRLSARIVLVSNWNLSVYLLLGFIARTLQKLPLVKMVRIPPLRAPSSTSVPGYLPTLVFSLHLPSPLQPPCQSRLSDPSFTGRCNGWIATALNGRDHSFSLRDDMTRGVWNCRPSPTELRVGASSLRTGSLPSVLKISPKRNSLFYFTYGVNLLG